MRAIEFRGKKRTTLQPKNVDLFNESEKDNDWVYGSFSNGIEGNGAHIMPHCYTAGLIEISEDVDEDEETVIEYGTDVFLGGWFQVFPESVGQFTGLLDKNGTKIFEGDLYKTYYNELNVYQVFFKNGSFCGGLDIENCVPLGWKVDIDESEEVYEDDETTGIMEIIGNVFDNKDLCHGKV
jgi:hypothetical protein